MGGCWSWGGMNGMTRVSFRWGVPYPGQRVTIWDRGLVLFFFFPFLCCTPGGRKPIDVGWFDSVFALSQRSVLSGSLERYTLSYYDVV
jgi:hypothetical protein